MESQCRHLHKPASHTYTVSRHPLTTPTYTRQPTQLPPERPQIPSMRQVRRWAAQWAMVYGLRVMGYMGLQHVSGAISFANISRPGNLLLRFVLMLCSDQLLPDHSCPHPVLSRFADGWPSKFPPLSPAPAPLVDPLFLLLDCPPEVDRLTCLGGTKGLFIWLLFAIP